MYLPLICAAVAEQTIKDYEDNEEEVTKFVS